VEQVGYQIIIFYHLSPTNGWTNGGGKSHLRHHVEAILKKNSKMWEECLPHVEFAYNRAIHSTIKVSPFQVVYDFNPHAPIDFLPLPTSERIHSHAKECADFIFQMHETTKHNIEKMNEKYRIAGS
jgi:hypothetical protein